ncbi:MAG: family 10 glycosylhydrolase [Ruminococcus sp.]|nr:family 10 glycosylhydrolase [Ruminococcus sp.]MDE6849429.1 family 10 glycosylhydrolase [Ruminococcus sp.]
MKRIFLSAIMILCTSCAVPENYGQAEESVTSYVQEMEQLYIDSDTEEYVPLNYINQIGMWFPYMHFDEYMYRKTADEFRTAVREKFVEAQKESVNTVYLHIHPCGDAYYRSDIFPSGTYLDGDYDPLEIMTEEAHSLGLSVHAWLNPLRCQTVEQMKNVPESFIVRQWAENPECHFVEIVNDRWYLNPAYDETVQLICDAVDEITDNYNIDGIHIDDYFYPTTDPEFDRTAFENSGSDSLEQWRTENCTRFVKAIYDTVKKHDKNMLFGISPQGNIDANYNTQYADVRLWGNESGYCDYIVPQIYFGFQNETCPFVPTLAEWETLVSDENVMLIIGLGAYKLGQEDKWAGVAGEQEWIENPDIIRQQIELVNSSSAVGYALYY